MFYDWYPRSWWTQQGLEGDTNCTDSEIAQFLDMAISVRRYPLVLDTALPTDAGIVSFRNLLGYHQLDCMKIIQQTHLLKVSKNGLSYRACGPPHTFSPLHSPPPPSSPGDRREGGREGVRGGEEGRG